MGIVIPTGRIQSRFRWFRLVPMTRPGEILRRTFGFVDFRSPWEQVIDHLLQGKDALEVMPAGGGNSLCHQLPALLLPDTAIVVSPLIALLQDQVRTAGQLGIRAACLNSGMSAEEQRNATEAYRQGQLDLLYLAPQRLQHPETLELLSSSPHTGPVHLRYRQHSKEPTATRISIPVRSTGVPETWVAIAALRIVTRKKHNNRYYRIDSIY